MNVKAQGSITNMPIDIPTLESERLLLRAHQPADLDSAFELWADAETVRYVGGDVRSREATWRKMLSLNGIWSMRPFGYWAVVLKSRDVFIGQIGFADFAREAAVALPSTPEAGWAIHPGYRGQGFVSEALAAALRWLDARQPSILSSHCLIHPDNAPSLTAARRAGYVPWSRTIVGGQLCIVLVRDITSLQAC